MTQEEKARAYDEALKRAIKHRNEDPLTLEQYETISIFFPKLGEGEESKDDKIRKVIRGWINTQPASFFDNGISKEEMLAWLERQGNTNETIDMDEFAQGVLRGAAINLITWIDYNAAEGSMCLSNTECKDITDALVKGDWNKIYAYMKKKLEKQGEKKSINNVEPKFHKGEWIVHCGTGNIYQVVAIIDNQYQLKYGDNYTIQKCTDIDRIFYIWTIQDAKDGDILASCHEQPFVYNGNFDSFHVGAYCGIDYFGAAFITDESDRDWTCNKDIHPATKEQRDLLFQKIKEAGYKWDAEKKELKKLNQ